MYKDLSSRINNKNEIFINNDIIRKGRKTDLIKTYNTTQDIKGLSKNLNEYDILVFFTSAGINSLKQNFPNFKQGNTRIACFGVATANSLLQLGYRLDIYAPNPKNPSMTGALDEYIKEANKRQFFYFLFIE